MLNKLWPRRSPRPPKDDPLIRIKVPGLTVEIDRELLRTIAAVWPLLLRGGRRSLPWLMWVMTPLLTVLWVGMNDVGANIQEKLCQQPIRDITPMVAEDASPQQEGLEGVSHFCNFMVDSPLPKSLSQNGRGTSIRPPFSRSGRRGWGMRAASVFTKVRCSRLDR
ncbi:MAG: hypothetical protein F6K30_04580 [Cyanothece sp. SIO2G6]|nr:hypothetical protein [Cyanothece sp. SIO2G6]